jgi:F0F1-type ATP synthase assembly protein I
VRRAQPYIDASWQLIGAIVLCTFGGLWLDRRFGTSPWFVIVGALFGVGAGLLVFLRLVLRLERREKTGRGAPGSRNGPPAGR